MSNSYRTLILVVALAATGCMEIDPPNEIPTASITVVHNGMALMPTPMMGVTAPAYVIMGAPTSVTLQGVGMDSDGMIVAYEWWRTDVSRAMRTMPGTTAGTGAGGAGGMGAPPPPPFAGDPPPTPTVTVDLPVAGNYRYSLWVTDDGGFASAPASVTLVVR